MTITIDRQSGLFTPELSDRINTMSDNLWNDIQALEVPDKKYKETVTPFKIQTTVPTARQNCFSVGRVHIINIVFNGEIKSENKFVELGYLPFTPSTNIITTNGTYEAIYKVEAGTNKLLINTLENTLKSFECYFFYVS